MNVLIFSNIADFTRATLLRKFTKNWTLSQIFSKDCDQSYETARE